MPRSRTLIAGISASLTGQFSVQGKQALAGLQAWSEDVNHAGGMIVDSPDTRWPITVVHHDDQSQPDRARQITSSLIQNDAVDLLFGPYSSVLSMAAAEIAEAHQKVLWNQGGAADNIYQKGFGWTVGILAPASAYLSGLLPLIRKTDASIASIGIIQAYPGAFPHAVSSAVHRQARELGFQVNYIREFPPSLTDFSGVLEEVRGKRLQILVVVGRIANDIGFAQQLAAAWTSVKVAAIMATPIQQFVDALGGDAQGFIGPSQWEPEANYPSNYGPSSESVLASLKSRASVSVDYPMAQGYAAGLVAQACVEKAGSLEDVRLRASASDLDISTFYGRFKIDSDTGKQTGHSTLLVQWQDGKKVTLWPPELARGRLVYPGPKG
ncbi:MAG TPA: hypothetical protein EYM38_08325 [Dehalococcoidia bacterium]|nr:hypothetical protein [Dehalococcoidia bacterium]